MTWQRMAPAKEHQPGFHVRADQAVQYRGDPMDAELRRRAWSALKADLWSHLQR
jgi:hypothetical protein